MINLFGKLLVLVHTVLCLLGMAWALIVFLQGRDLGYATPIMDVLERNADGVPTKAILHASDYDKSYAALTAAAATRDRTYLQVQPAIDELQKTEPHLSNNHLFFRSELRRLKHAKIPLDIRHLKDGGVMTPGLGIPLPEANPVKIITKSIDLYQQDLDILVGTIDPVTKKRKTAGKIDLVEEEIQGIDEQTTKFTAETTGTNESNNYIKPGLNQMYEQEFQAQRRIKEEAEDIKPYWSQAIEQANLLQFRRIDLEAQRDKLRDGLPPHLKDNKKK